MIPFPNQIDILLNSICHLSYFLGIVFLSWKKYILKHFFSKHRKKTRLKKCTQNLSRAETCQIHILWEDNVYLCGEWMYIVHCTVYNVHCTLLPFLDRQNIFEWSAIRRLHFNIFSFLRHFTILGQFPNHFSYERCMRDLLCDFLTKLIMVS